MYKEYLYVINVYFCVGEKMKSKIIVLNRENRKKIFILIILMLIVFIVYFLINKNKDTNYTKYEHIKQTNSYTSRNSDVKDINLKDKINKDVIQIEEYTSMPSEVKGYKVIGRLIIPSISLDTYILEETNNQALNVSVTKLIGPNINEVGNFCITGHNYFKKNMFGKLRKVNKNDKIYLLDTFGKEQEYIVYDKFEIPSSDTSVLTQNTRGKKEVTLITCTIGAIKRLVVKAVEI